MDSQKDKDLIQQFSKKFLDILRSKNDSKFGFLDRAKSNKIESCLIVLNIMCEGDLYERFQFNTKRYREKICAYLDNFEENPYDVQLLDNSIDELFIMCMAFLREYLLSSERFYWSENLYDLAESSSEHQKIKNSWKQFKADVEQKIYPIPPSLKEEVQYVRNDMDLDILNFYLGQNIKNCQVFENYEEKAKEAEEKNLSLENRLREINQLEDRLNTTYNFVGLSKGFENLLKKKEKAKSLTFWGLCVLLITALVPVGYSFFKFTGDDLSWQKMLPVIGLEFVLIYFFRVVLTHYHSIQTQIMQLELRQSLCQFIQNYANFAKEIKASDKDALEKFENLIFSSILSNPDKVPGTFDGIDGLTSLLKEIKGSK